RVQAKDNAGNVSNFDQIAVVKDSIPPGNVTNLRVDNRVGSVVLTWDPRPAGENVVAYNIYYGPTDSTNKATFTSTFAAQGPSPVRVTATPTPNANLSGLINDTSFFVAVTALDAAGNESALLSNTAAANPSEAPIDLRFEDQIGSACQSSPLLNEDLAA